MQLPQISKIIILAHGVPFNYVKSVSLGLEIICGQRFFCTALSDPIGQNLKVPSNHNTVERKNWGRSNVAWQSGKAKARNLTNRGSGRFVLQSNSSLLYCSLRARTMYNFLEKLISLRLTSLVGYEYKIQGQEIQLCLSNREMRMFPEIQNHFEFFEALKAVQIKLVTSASNEQETRLLWTGLQQKEI